MQSGLIVLKAYPTWSPIICPYL